ncbi:hypothetical protein VFPBJ_11776 [Purpureocillium lilacinum]|uniref:Uncharacterized protein n=1 Tax=Purpureocillium lilacinum TaxID=33203 RepID=A0A179EVN0_PURLI|nr:hypothetical protein VFPBJ_11776 [Purpureocillium lilacinum]
MLQDKCKFRFYGTRTVVGRTKARTIFWVLLRLEWDEPSNELCDVLRKPGNGFEPSKCQVRQLKCCGDALKLDREEWGDVLRVRKGTSMFGEWDLSYELDEDVDEAEDALDTVE